MAFREILQAHLSARIGKNKQYSLRAFARDLNISPSKLSKILGGKQTLSHAKSIEIARILYGDPTDQLLFIEIVEKCNAPNSPQNEAALACLVRKLKREDESAVPSESLSFLSSWSVFCIFDLFSLHPAPVSFAEIARKIGVTDQDAKLAIESLVSAGLLEPDGIFFRKRVEKFTTSNGISSHTIRNLHKQFISKALIAVDEQEIERRYLRARTLALDAGKIQEAFALVEKFMLDLSKLEDSCKGRADSLYQINVQAFDLIKEKKNEKAS